MPKPSVSATRLAGRAPAAVTVTPGRTPPSGPTTRPSMAPVVVWAVAAPAAPIAAARSQRQIDPLLRVDIQVHIHHLLERDIRRRAGWPITRVGTRLRREARTGRGLRSGVWPTW